MVKIEGKAWLTVADLVDWIGCCRITVYNWRDLGMPGRKYGHSWFFPYQETKKWIEDYRNVKLDSFLLRI